EQPVCRCDRSILCRLPVGARPCRLGQGGIPPPAGRFRQATRDAAGPRIPARADVLMLGAARFKMRRLGALRRLQQVCGTAGGVSPDRPGGSHPLCLTAEFRLMGWGFPQLSKERTCFGLRVRSTFAMAIACSITMASAGTCTATTGVR